MKPILSFLVANQVGATKKNSILNFDQIFVFFKQQALANKNSIILDPFVGTGSVNEIYYFIFFL